MDFLDKLYESNYFGIGLFAVISFLVVTFLVVLFFGKRDEKKRKLEETNNINLANSGINNDTFKETSEVVPLEVPAEPIPESTLEPVSPIEPVMPTSFNETPLEPVAPINYEEHNNFIENVTIEDPKPIEPIKPIIPEPTPVVPEIKPEPIIEPFVFEPVKFEEPEVKPIEPIKYDPLMEPKVMEPIRFEIPVEPIKSEPIIKEEIKPLITPVIEPVLMAEEEKIDTYYKPIEKVEPEEIKVPNIDFDAIAKSISDELDELEKSTNKSRYEEIKVTPMNNITSRPASNQFSSVYVNEPVKTFTRESIELPKKIDLPVMKSEEIEPESYNILN